MENITIEHLLKKINELEKRIENYFNHLKIDNELDFILKGTYVLRGEVLNIINGLY